MSWKKHFQKHNTQHAGQQTKQSRWQSWLPEVYSGMPNRTERYTQYDQMDQDSEVNSALDTIAEFSTQTHPETQLPFDIFYKSEATDAEVSALSTALKQWCSINDFERRAFNIVRAAIKYGDHFFIRDPETFKLYWVAPEDVTKAVVNESNGKEIDQYIMRNINLNLHDMVLTDTRNTQNMDMHSSPGFTNTTSNSGLSSNQMTGNQNEEFTVDGSHVVHISMTDGMTASWPFGQSILESVFKVYKQKELLEDSIIIYRVQRAPERRVFYIDVGNMPAHKAMGFVERVKNEVHQTRIPNKTGGGSSVVDAAYNPLSIMEDYFFAHTAEGRGSKVEVLPGGENLGEIDDLKYFSNKLLRGLRIPSSYLPTSSEDGTATYNDGRLGTALIQEYRFSKYCERIQLVLQPALDNEFKMFLKHRGIDVTSSLFDLKFVEPQSFSKYREIELDSTRSGVFTSLEGVEYLSRQFLMKKYLGLTEAEITENEMLWRSENNKDMPNTDPSSDLGSIGLRAGDVDGFEETDIDDDFDDEFDGVEPDADTDTDTGEIDDEI
jgi:hypothetical protein